MEPTWYYHPDGRQYLCRDEDYHSTLPDCDEWETLPFSGPRKVIEKSATEEYNELVDKYNLLLDKYKTLLRAKVG